MSIEKPRPALFEADVNADVPFYIPATGPETRPWRTLKHDDSFLVIAVFRPRRAPFPERRRRSNWARL
jgi:hypothetical protein